MVESLPVHEDIKRGGGDLTSLFDAYRQSLINLAAEGIKTVCYSLMPVLDWTRTDLTVPLPRGGTCLQFSAPKMAAFEIHMLERTGAGDDYHPDAVQVGTNWFQASTKADQADLLHAIMSGLPGAIKRYNIDALKEACGTYAGLSHDDLRHNLARFLSEVIPTAEAVGINLCIHPDDPPRPILGLPRIMSTKNDIQWIMRAVDSPASGLTLCTGSLGSHYTNDIVDIACTFADHIHFAHLRNVTKAPHGSFSENDHFKGDVDPTLVIALQI